MNKYARLGILAFVLHMPAGAMGAASILDIFKPLMGPRIDITVDHPPSLPLKVSAIAIAKPEGQCGDEIGSRVEEDFVQSHITVIDRQRLNEVLSEFKLQTNQMIDQGTAAKVGKLLGAQALLFLKVMSCSAGNSRQEGYTDKKTHRTTYTYITQGAVSGSVRVIDLSTGRVLAAQHFEGSGGLQSMDGYPGREAALDEAHKVAATSIHRMLLPWSETKSLVFYDDAQCDLKEATRRLRSKDFEGALQQSQSNLAACKQAQEVKPVTIARAHYNLGLLQFMQRDYDAALANLGEADKLASSKVFQQALAECREAQRLAALAPDDVPATVAKPTVPSTPRTGPPSIKDRLATLEELRAQKLITQTEYEQRRTKILSEI